MQEIAIKEIHFSQYIKSKQKEINLIFSVFDEIKEDKKG
jgi:hypothetical protein